jgi:hypothetical protein
VPAIGFLERENETVAKDEDGGVLIVLFLGRVGRRAA